MPYRVRFSVTLEVEGESQGKAVEEAVTMLKEAALISGATVIAPDTNGTAFVSEVVDGVEKDEEVALFWGKKSYDNTPLPPMVAKVLNAGTPRERGRTRPAPQS